MRVAGGPDGRGGRAPAPPPRDRARPARVRAPGAPARATFCSRSVRRRQTTAACACRSSAGSSARSSRESPRSRRSGSPTTSSRGPSGALPRTSRRPDDRRPQARRHPARRAARDPRASPARSSSALAANALNQLDTKPGRALKAYALAAIPLGAPLAPAVMLAPYDLREMAMLGDSGSNALGALLGLSSVDRLTGRGRWLAIGALAALNLLGERTSLGDAIERDAVFCSAARPARAGRRCA